MSKLAKFLLTVTVFLMGVILGFVLSPAQKGIGSNNDNTFIYCKPKTEADTDTDNAEATADEKAKD